MSDGLVGARSHADADELILVGAVAKAHALSGELAVVAFNPASAMWQTDARLAVLPPISRTSPEAAADRVRAVPLRWLTVTRARAAGDDRLIVACAEVKTRDDAEALAHHRLAVPLSSLPPAEDETFYHHELAGLEVVGLGGESYGRVVGVMPGPAQDLLEVATEGVRETWLIPFVGAIVREVDKVGRRIVVDLPEGLQP